MLYCLARLGCSDGQLRVSIVQRSSGMGRCCSVAQEESVFDIIPGDVVSSNILAAAAALTQVLSGFLYTARGCGTCLLMHPGLLPESSV